MTTSRIIAVLAAAALIIAFAGVGYAEVVTRDVEYTKDGTTMEGYLAYDDSLTGIRPGVLVVHEWTGLGPYAKSRAEELAALGYAAFAADIYGKGVRPGTREEAQRVSGIYTKDRALLRERVRAGLDALLDTGLADPKRIAAIGYCFGGAAVLELARSGADVAGVVSFHGSLSNPNPDDAKNIKAKVLVLWGADDPFVDQEQVDAFMDEMRAADADWQLHAYGGAVHSFTVPTAGNDPSTGAAYDGRADRRSWREMREFLEEVFK